MTTQISTFNFKSHPVRIEVINTEPHFCLTDVCLALSISNANSSRFKFNEAGVHKMYISFPSGKKEVTFINEPNLYRIIFRSNKSQAIEFQNWVFEEVLPQIRKTGQYSVQQPLALPEPEKKYTFEFTEYELEQLTWLLFSHKQMNDLLGLLIQPLEALGSRYSASVYSHHHEYKRHYTESLDTVKRLTEPFKKSDRLNWKRIIHRLTA
ncbi:putative phage-encoded protein [Glaesserella parasuis]|uniref:P22AR C-terminal domain-containing protein n=1 Tax=Glaesserella parasuis TaxID=738 RepID=UPI0004DD1B83|nr:P22AR C-terminal domain-containing protein [Glaesserella parasuis]KEZ23147.1 putative phage-encoded protein [Glaesserella parasuis]